MLRPSLALSVPNGPQIPAALRFGFSAFPSSYWPPYSDMRYGIAGVTVLDSYPFFVQRIYENDLQV